MPLLAVEPLQQGKTPGRLGTTDRSTHRRKKIEPRNLHSCESSRRNLQPVSRFPRAGQNVMAATMLLRNMPEPSNSQARRIRDEVQTLLQVAAVQQAESSASRRQGAATEKRDELAHNEKEVSVHQQPPP